VEAAITAAVGTAEEAVLVHIPEVQAVDLQAALQAVDLQAAAVDVLPEVALLHPVADNYRKQIKFRFN